jgi:hypothetical protein
MIKVYDYKCKNGHVHERFDSETPDFVPCPVCGEQAWRLVCTPRFELEGVSGSFPTATDKWVARRESHMAVERKNQEKHGTYK